MFKVVTKKSVSYHGKTPENKYHDEMSLHNVLAYVMDPRKTNADLIGGFAVNPEMAEDQFEMIARNYGKDFGIRLRHMVLSFSEREKVDPFVAKNIAYQIAAYYAYDYQIIYAVHTDSRCLNIHFVMNSVSYRTGKKYDGKKEDYYHFLEYMERILRSYGMQLREWRD